MKSHSTPGLIPFLAMVLLVLANNSCSLHNNINYSYSDGNGNTYIIRVDDSISIEYRPVKPDTSSSGIFDGGDYKKKKLGRQQYEKIIASIMYAVKNKAIHIDKRIKMSGLIIIDYNKKRTSYIVKPGARELLQIEKLLKESIQ